MYFLQATFEDAAQGGVSGGGQASSSPAPEQGGQETVAERATLADAALGVATQMAAGVRGGTAGLVNNVREVGEQVRSGSGLVLTRTACLLL